MLLLISQLAGYFKSNRNRYLLADNMTKEVTLQGINLCSARTVALWNDTKAAAVQNMRRLRVKMWQEHSSDVTRKENNNISLFPQPPVLYEMLLGMSTIQSYLE